MMALMDRQVIVDLANERFDGGEADGLLLADGFEDAFLGFASRSSHGPPCAVYDAGQCRQILVLRDGMTPDEAQEFFEFNVAGAWIGERTPIFVESVES